MGFEEVLILGRLPFLSNINCIKGNNMPIEAMAKIIDSRIDTKYQAIEDLYSFK
jgi:hypothetical protein